VSLIGSNGAGKTTTLKAICGLLKPQAGQVSYMGQSTSGLGPWDLVAKGLVMVPEGRGIFARMSIDENLRMGAYLRRDDRIEADIDAIYQRFGRLKERRQQLAGTLSGGEQQMLAMGRALMALPKVLLLDEPSMGLAPIMVDKIFEVVRDVAAQGVSVLLVEQNAHRALEMAQRAYVMDSGVICWEIRRFKRPIWALDQRPWPLFNEGPLLNGADSERARNLRRQRSQLGHVTHVRGVRPAQISDRARDHVDVKVRHGLPRFRPIELHQHDPLGAQAFFHGVAHLAHCAHAGSCALIGQLEDRGGGLLGDHQRMAIGLGHDVHEAQGVLIFIDLEAGDLAAQDLGKDVVGVVGHEGLSRVRVISQRPCRPGW